MDSVQFFKTTDMGLANTLLQKGFTYVLQYINGERAYAFLVTDALKEALASQLGTVVYSNDVIRVYDTQLTF